jgi:hypothetical protein
MKTMRLLMMVMLSCVLLAGCKPTGQCTGGQCLTMEVEVDGIPTDGLSLKTAAYAKVNPASITDAAVAHVYVKCFQESSRIHLPQAGIAGSVLSLARDSQTNRWKGDLSLINPHGAVVFLAYAVDADGKHLYSGIHETGDIESVDRVPFTITVHGNSNGSTAAYTSGEWGPGGGWIFYDAGNYAAGWRYMEAAPVAWNGGGADPQAVWGAEPSSVGLTGSTYRSVGRGKSNTDTLVTFNNNYPLTGTAAQLCKSLNFNAFSDWFLPSSNELSAIDDALYSNSLGNIQTKMYWSSSEGNTLLSRVYDFGNLGDVTADKNTAYYVRPARRF